CLAIVTKASAAFGTFRHAVAEDEFSCLLIKIHDVRLSAGGVHFMKGPQLIGVLPKPDFDRRPLEIFVPMDVGLEADFQLPDKRLALFRGQDLLHGECQEIHLSLPLFKMECLKNEQTWMVVTRLEGWACIPS